MKKLIFASQIMFLFITLLILVTSIQAAPIPEDMPLDKVDDIVIYAKGDEHYCQFYVIGSDKEKYTVVQGEDGKWSYATTDSESGKLVSGFAPVDKFISPPEEAKDLEPKGLELLKLRTALDNFNRSMDKVNKEHTEKLAQNQSQNQTTTYQVHTIFVEFPDCPHTFEAGQFLSMLYSNRNEASYNQTPDGYPAYGSVRDYWDEVSRGQVDIQAITHYPTEGEWFMMPNNREYYRTNVGAFFDDLSAVTGLTFWVSHKWVFVVAGDAGYANTTFYPSSYGPMGSDVANMTILTERFRLFREPEPQFYFLAMGVAAHEFGHLLFGLPDYAYSTSYWDIMGLGCYGYGDQQTPNPEKPVHPSAIARIRAGFADVVTLSGEGVTKFSKYNLPDVESTGKILHLDNDDNDTNFYLEVRQPYNNVFDSDITGDSSGLVVWFTFINENGYFPDPGPWYPIKAGYLNATFGHYWDTVTISAFPGQNHKTEIGYDTAPPFTANNRTNKHYLNDLRKNIKSLAVETPEGEETIINLFSMDFHFERWNIKDKISVVSLDDDNAGLSQGDADGLAEVGERIEVVFKIENKGTAVIPSMQGSFDTGTDVRCLTQDFPIEEIPAGGFVQTPTIVFDILTQPVSGNYHQVRLVDRQFIDLGKVILLLEIPNIPIVTDPSVQSLPDISGDKIVWGDNRNGNSDIYLYDLATNTERQITNSVAIQRDPAISGDKIVWVDMRNWDIYLYDLTTNTERQITNNTSAQTYPDISGDKIVWVDNRNGNDDIYLYDLATNTERQITNNPANQFLPTISGNKIVWVDNGNYNIYLYALETNTELQITNNTAYKAFPAISGDKIVWQDYRNGNFDIYLYDLATNTEQQITTNTANQDYPAISADKIVWQDNRNGNFDIYLYDLATNSLRQITNNPANEFLPAISENKIVWHDNRNGNPDIFMDYYNP